jgi:hypothetical protein
MGLVLMFLVQYGVQKRTNNLDSTLVILEAIGTREADQIPRLHSAPFTNVKTTLDRPSSQEDERLFGARKMPHVTEGSVRIV